MSERLEKMFPEFTPHQVRQISVNLSGIAKTMMFESNSETMNALHDANLELEQHKKLFRTYIDDISSNSKSILGKLEVDGLVSYKKNTKTNKLELIGRSTIITQMVKFLNDLNDIVINFYEEVYKIEPDKNTNSSIF